MYVTGLPGTHVGAWSLQALADPRLYGSVLTRKGPVAGTGAHEPRGRAAAWGARRLQYGASTPKGEIEPAVGPLWA